MNKFNIGETVELPKDKYPKVPGTVISFDTKQEKYLVRFNGIQQLYFSEEELKSWNK